MFVCRQIMEDFESNNAITLIDYIIDIYLY